MPLGPGATFPRWSRSRSELFYYTLDQKIGVASYSVDGNTFRADQPRVWSEAPLVDRRGPRLSDLHPDGQRFAVIGPPPGQSEIKQDKVVFILNFFDYLRGIARPKGGR